jgi:hypothetical protein
MRLIRRVGSSEYTLWLGFREKKRDKGRINVGVKWEEMTSDRTNISFAGKRTTFLTENVLRKGDKDVLQVS